MRRDDDEHGTAWTLSITLRRRRLPDADTSRLRQAVRDLQALLPAGFKEETKGTSNDSTG